MELKKVLAHCIKEKPMVIVLLIFFYPLGLYCMWKGEHFSLKIRAVISGLLALWTLILVLDSSGPTPGPIPTCTAVLEQGNCTYYRDENCNVIAQSCE